MIRVRRYRALDIKECLALLDVNTPKHFGSDERPEFEKFLRSKQDCFLVAQRADRLLACGGIELFPGRDVAEYRWVMTAPNFQGRGIGRLLILLSTRYSLQHANIHAILVHTTPQSAGFFRKLGFENTRLRVEENYWGPNLHLELLRLELPEHSIYLVESALAQYGARDLIVENIDSK